MNDIEQATTSQSEIIERDAMDDLDDAINALVRRGTDTWQRERALAVILLAGSPWQPAE